MRTALLFAALVACSKDTPKDGDTTPPSEWDADDHWLCKPGMDYDYCLDEDLDGVEAHADGTYSEVTWEPATETDFDCFYVHPTVFIDGTGQATDDDIADTEKILDPLLGQGARFNQLCTVWAPRYHQVYLNTIFAGEADPYFEKAYEEIDAAFAYFLEHTDRDFVLIGHSQGTAMLTMLVQREIDGVPELQDRMISGLLLGAHIMVPNGQTVGGTFTDVPICTSADETGCIVAFRTFEEDRPPSDLGEPGPEEVACVDPAALLGRDKLAGAWLATVAHQDFFDMKMTLPAEIDKDWALYRDFYTSECIQEEGETWLSIGTADDPADQRTDIVDYDIVLLSPMILGTHVFDYHFPMQELLDLVERQAQAMD